MEFYLRLESIPELAPLSKAQRTEVWAATIGPRLRSKDFFFGLLVLLLFMALGGFLGGHFIPGNYGTMIGCMTFYFPGFVLAWGFSLPQTRQAIAAEVERRRARGLIV